jgi:hypothetical protein
MYDSSFLLKHIAEEKKKRMKTGRKELPYNGTVNRFLALLQHK